jgi:hypothetical protein
VACLGIPLDGFRTDVSSRSDIIAFRPQRRMFPPILATQDFKLFLQSARYNPREQADDFSRSKFRRCAYQQMHVIRHDLNCQYFKPVWCGGFRQPFFQSCLDRPKENLFPIARYPDQMVLITYARCGLGWVSCGIDPFSQRSAASSTR